MKIKSVCWFLIGTAVVLLSENQRTWGAQLGPALAPVAAPGFLLGPGTTSVTLSGPTSPVNESAVLSQMMTTIGPSFLSLDIRVSWKGQVCDGNQTRWVGVKCTMGKVSDLNLTGHVFGGVLPSQLYLLPSLVSFECRNCSISGGLPAQWGQAASLEMLFLENNPINGSLPADWGASKSLWYLEIRNNNLTGTLPETWANMSQLQWVDFSANNISGTLPSAYGALGKMNHFYMFGNQLTGTLPPSWATMGSALKRDFVSILLSSNRLSGPLPQEWANFRRLEELQLADNQLTGPLPPSWVNMSALTGLELFQNNLNGTLPAEWSSFQNRIKVLWLHNNAFTGTLPPEWGSFTGINALYLNNNDLTGMPRWDRLLAVSTACEGTLPPSWGSMANVSEMSLKDNVLSGSLPDAWGGMTSMKTLSLSSNQFNGSLPGNSWALGMQSLGKLYVRNNSLTGELPAEWFSTANVFPNLLAIDVRWNELHGPVPKLSNGSTFLPTINRSPKLYVLPMDKGYGLCGESPNPGPILFEFLGLDWNPNSRDEGRVTLLPSCTSGPRLPIWAVISIAIGSGSLVAVVSVVMYIVMRVRRRRAGSSVGESFLRSSLGSFKMPFPMDWHSPKTSGGTVGRTASKSGKEGTYSGTSGLTPTSTGTPSTGSGSGPLSTTDSGSATDSARGGRGTLLSSSDRRMSKTSSLARHVSRGGMRTEDLIFATESNNRRVTLGSGAFGQVYKASWHGTDVAVKVLKDDHLEMLLENELPDDVEKARNEQQQQFEHEAALLSTLRHPNIVNFLGFTVNGTDMMVVTELCDGGDLAKAIRRHRHTKAMGWYTRGAKLSLDVACGLAYLHTMGIIHYDIKPGNILLDKLGSTAKISDVGLSKSLATLQGTGSNTVRGTFEYMAPELMFGQRSTFAVDVYSFGVMLREIITGEAPDKRAAPPREPRIPEECPEAAWRLYWRCIDPDPSKRPSSSELVEHLRDLQPPPRANSAAMPPTPKDSKDKTKSKAKIDGKLAIGLESTPEQEAPGQEK